MNWKHENGYKVEGIIRGSERELYPIYIVKAQDGFAFVSPSYLDPWNSGHSAHLVKGVITEENPQAVLHIPPPINEQPLALLQYPPPIVAHPPVTI